MSRPTKLTKQTAERIVAAIAAGNYAKVAAEAAGISESTLYDWLKRGEAGEAPFSEFSESVARARAKAEIAAVAALRQAMTDDWRAAVEYLRRSRPERWGDRSRAEVTGIDGGPVKLEHKAGLTIGDVLKLAQELDVEPHGFRRIG